MAKQRVYLYDSTLRDGAQARGIDFTVADKIAITKELDALGIDYVEGGWPGANPNDDAYFAAIPKTKKACVTAFGMTRRSGRSAENDPGLQDLLQADTKSICLVGKAWAHQVQTALKVSLKENLRMIEESLSYLKGQKREMLFDAEHFFDGYKSDKDYALEVVKTAYDAGARWVVLCDTNGGTMPSEVAEIVADVVQHIPGDHLGIHCHNDTDQAVANSIAAVQAGVRQVQGTINGIGERCGNANLISVIGNLALKMEYETGVTNAKLKQLRAVSRFVDERLSRDFNLHAPYVGDAAFAHKGGLHVSAMAKDTSSYEHIDPALVGNERVILVSDKAGKSNILTRLNQMGMKIEPDNPKIDALVKEIKQREKIGYAYDDADASFELLVRRRLGSVPTYFDLESFRLMDERRRNIKGNLVTVSEATVKLKINGDDEVLMTVAEGNGPVNALDAALRKALVPHYKALKHLQLSDYKVRILTPQDATAAITRVMIESADEKGRSWTTIGVSANVIDASFNALHDAISYMLLKR
ncbi:MAG: citramalate synthase [Rickettsiales bacterium]|nr:citramalate synthase [Rickettsiales bacterium]